jgi:predicted TIM-barrel fold metal-dependent hydrolase
VPYEYNHKYWEPLWDAIEESGLPVSMHQGTGHDMLFYRGPGAAVSNLLATQSHAPRTASLLATSGVLERHPELHFAFVEMNASWIGWCMDTIDFYYDSFQEYPNWVKPILSEKPSTYLTRQVHGTFQWDPSAINNISHTGVPALMWGSDYPHAEGTYPHSRKIAQELCGDLPEDQARAILGGTAIDLFGFDRAAVSTPVPASTR